MGILNVTPDSFSDGSLFLDPGRAVERALEMEEEGADSIDIGGESTRPYAPPVDEDQELRRVIPVIERLAGRLRVPISIDTYKASVAREAIRAGAEIVNDVSGCTFDPRMLEVVSSSSAGLILMHTRGTPAEMQRNTAYSALVPEIIHFLRERLSAAESCWYLDPADRGGSRYRFWEESRRQSRNTSQPGSNSPFLPGRS